MPSTTSVKAELGTTGDLRRFQLPGHSAAELTRKLVSLFPQLEQGVFSVTWRDEDNDWVTVASDDDLAIAVESTAGQTLRLRAVPAVTSESDTSRTAAPPSAAPTDRSSTGAPVSGAPQEDPAKQFEDFIAGMCRRPPAPFRRIFQGIRRFHESVEVPEGVLLPAATIAPGSHGPGVAQLQHVLIKNGLMDARAIRCHAGLYGPLTTRAIWSFQQQSGVSAATPGVFDEATRSAILDAFDLQVGTVPEPSTPETVSQAEPPTHTPDAVSPAPAPATTPPHPERATEPEDKPDEATPFAAQLEGLRAMGFEVDVGTVIPLLEDFKGSIEQLIAVLVDETGQQ